MLLPQPLGVKHFDLLVELWMVVEKVLGVMWPSLKRHFVAVFLHSASFGRYA